MEQSNLELKQHRNQTEIYFKSSKLCGIRNGGFEALNKEEEKKIICA